MEESSTTRTSIHEKSELEPPMNDSEIKEQEITTLVSPLPHSAEPEEEWGPIPDEIFIKDVPATFTLLTVIAVILGILSLLLMITSGFFGYQYFQNMQQSASKMDDFTKELETFHSKVENFTGVMKKIQEDIVENLKVKNEKPFDIPKMQKTSQGSYSEPCLKSWKQYKDNCYHQTLKMVTWFNCSNLCISMNSTFLLSGKDMLIDSMKNFTLNETWIGISYHKDSKEWEVDSSFSSKVSTMPEEHSQDLCVYMKQNTMDFYHCNKTLPCICEKALGAEN